MRILGVLVGLLFLPTWAYAFEAKLSAEFEYTGEASGFEMFVVDKDGPTMVSSTEGDKREMTWTQEITKGECYAFYMKAYDSEGTRSSPSTPYHFCTEEDEIKIKVRPNAPINIQIVIEE